MKRLLLSRPLASLSVSAMLACILFSFVPFPFSFLLFLPLAASPFLARYFRKRLCRHVLLLILCFSFAGIPSLIRTALPKLQLPEENSAASYEVSFRIIEIVDRDAGLYGIENVTLDQAPFSFPMLLETDDPNLSLGDEGTVYGKIGATEDLRFYRSEGYAGYIKATDAVTLTGGSDTLRVMLNKLRSSFGKRIGASVSDEAGSIAAALLLGETDLLSSPTQGVFRRLGISHMLAVSGMHLVTLTAALMFFFRRLRIPRAGAVPILIVFVVMYAALVGFLPSVLRSAFMSIIFLLAYLFGRQRDSLTALLFSGAMILTIMPYQLYSLSFWLSFLATLGIILCFSCLRHPSLGKYLVRIPATVRTLLLYPILFTVAASLFTLPAVAIFFGSVSLLSIPANLLFSLPVQGLLCLSAFLLAFPTFGPLALLYESYCDLLLSGMHKMGAIPNAMLSFSHPILVAVSALTVITVLLLFLLPSVNQRHVLYSLSVCAAVTLISILLFSLPESDGKRIVMTSAGGGDMLLLADGTDRFLIDCSCGEWTAYTPVLSELKKECVTELDGYLLTHYHKNHLLHLSDLMKRIHIRHIYLPEPCLSSEQAIHRSIVEYLRSYGISYTVYQSSEEIRLSHFTVKSSQRLPSGLDTHYTFLTSVRYGASLFGYIPTDAASHLPRFFDQTSLTAVAFGSHGTTPAFVNTVTLPSTVRTAFVSGPYYAGCRFVSDEAFDLIYTAGAAEYRFPKA